MKEMFVDALQLIVTSSDENTVVKATMADLEGAETPKWEKGDQCEIYENVQPQWFPAKVVEVFSFKEGKFVKVQYGRKINEIPQNDPKIRSPTWISGKVNWNNVVEAVGQELYPKIAESMALSVEELKGKRTLKHDDLSGDATDRVIETLKTKKVLYNKEIVYIKGLVERARAFQRKKQSGTL